MGPLVLHQRQPKDKQTNIKLPLFETIPKTEGTFACQVRVMYVDVDVFGHATYNSYLRWQYMTADAFFLEKIPSYKQLVVGKRLRFKVRFASMRYKRGAIFGDTVTIQVQAANIRPTSFELLFTFVRAGDDLVLSLGKQIFEIEQGENNLELNIDFPLKSVLESVSVPSEVAKRY